MKKQWLNIIVSILLIAGLGIMIHACSSGSSGGGQSTIQLSGTVASGSGGYTVAMTKSEIYFARALSFMGFASPAYAAAEPTVDKVVAVPLYNGALDGWSMENSITQNINSSDGTFSLALSQATDWLLVLINSAATGTANQFVGSIAVNTGSADSLLNLPATDATVSSLALGTLSRPTLTTNDAISSTSVTGANFNMTASQLSSLAKNDDLFKNVMNLINNYNTSTKVWYQLRPDFTWYGNYSTIANVFSGSTWSYHHYTFQLDTNSTSVGIHEVCGDIETKKTLEFYPPSTVSQVGSAVTYGPSAPLSNDIATCQEADLLGTGTNVWEATEMGASGGDFYATDGYGDMSYSFPVWFSGSIPSGKWRWLEAGSEIATFDASVATPLSGTGKATGYVPSMKLTVDGSENITAVDIEWYYYDATSDKYTKVTATDLNVLKHFMSGYEIIMESGSNINPRRHHSTRLDPDVLHLAIPTGTNGWTFADSDAGTAFRTKDAASVGVFYESGGIGRFFFFFAPYN